MTENPQQQVGHSQGASNTEQDNAQGNTEEKLRKKNTLAQLLIEVVAVLVWSYALTKTFVFDLDLYLIQRFFPYAKWIVDYKLLLILGIISLIWMFKRSTSLAQSALYILLYPAIFCVWKVPKTLIRRRSWVGAFALIGILLSFFRNLKFNIIISFVGLTSICLIWRSQNTVALSISCILLFVLLIILYAKSLYVSFRPSLLFQIQSQVIDKFWKSARRLFVPSDELKNLPIEKMNEEQLQTWSTSLQFAIIFNHTCYFLTTKLRDFQRSRVNILYYIVNFLILVVITVVIYAAIFNGLYKIDHAQFDASFSPKFHHFLYYSINALCTASIPDFIATSILSRIATTAETASVFSCWLFYSS